MAFLAYLAASGEVVRHEGACNTSPPLHSLSLLPRCSVVPWKTPPSAASTGVAVSSCRPSSGPS